MVTTKKHILVVFVLALSLAYALLFHTKWGLSIQCYAAIRLEAQRYSRFIVPWLVLQKDFKRHAARVLKQSAVDDLYRARQIITPLLAEEPRADDYLLSGILNEMWGEYSNALHDYEEALRLNLGKFRNLDVSNEGLSNSIRRVRAYVKATEVTALESGNENRH